MNIAPISMSFHLFLYYYVIIFITSLTHSAPAGANTLSSKDQPLLDVAIFIIAQLSM